MLLTITTTYQPATDLGYLLHKRPSRVQSFDLSFGKVHIFYPEASLERCTAALLLDVDPISLVRRTGGPAAVKAQEPLRQQYAAVGAASQTALSETLSVLTQAATISEEVQTLLNQYQQRLDMAARYGESYRRYCWSVESLADLKLAPFHLLATESAVHSDKDHAWHMEILAKLCAAGGRANPTSPLLFTTPYKVIDVTDQDSQATGVAWWEELTARGGEGMVVKPFDFITRGQRGLVQPAVKCREREYLRIIYSPEYTAPEHLERLRARGLSAKRSLALREFTLGLEALERFGRREPFYRVHECVFGVLALESEPVNLRL